MKKAVIYARFSSTHQREESIDAQLRACREYASKHGLSIVKIYIDRALSAKTDEREQFMNMIDDCVDGKIQTDAVIVHKSDRFSRNRLDSLYYKKKLGKKRIRFISVVENFDNSPESIMLESMVDGFNEYYSKNLAREVMKGLKENAYKALHTGGSPPLGYDVNENKEYVVNETEAELVKRIFSDYLYGYSINKIVKKLNEHGFKTKYGNKFSMQAVSDILKNEKYIGTYLFNRVSKVDFAGAVSKVRNDSDKIIKIEDGMPAIIDKEMFKEVQTMLKEKNFTMKKHEVVENYLLSGLVYCGECGEKMIGNRRKTGPDRNYYVTYRCSGRKKFKNCDNKEINKDKLEEAVMNYMEEYFFTKDNIDSIVENVYEKYLERNKKLNNEYEIYNSRLQQADKEADRLLNIMLKEDATDKMMTRMKELDEEMKLLREVLSEIDEQSVKSMTKNKLRAYIMSNALIKGMDSRKKAVTIKRFVEKVEVFKDTVDVTLFVDYFNELQLKRATNKLEAKCGSGGGAEKGT